MIPTLWGMSQSCEVPCFSKLCLVSNEEYCVNNDVWSFKRHWCFRNSFFDFDSSKGFAVKLCDTYISGLKRIKWRYTMERQYQENIFTSLPIRLVNEKRGDGLSFADCCLSLLLFVHLWNVFGCVVFTTIVGFLKIKTTKCGHWICESLRVRQVSHLNLAATYF